MNAFVQSLRSLGTFRLLALAGVAIASIAFFVYLSSRLSAPGMSLLYSELDLRDSSQIVAKLEAAGVPYELRAGGTQIYVPADQALKMRMSLAQEGLPRGGSVGYEIFDRSETMGSSSFVQNVNRLRALEGELARTIGSMTPIRSARVHIVLPQRQLFTRDKQEPSASIIIQTHGGVQLSPTQVVAIQHLVAAAVPGLKPERISMVDGRGNLLARGDKQGDTPEMVAATADEMRRNYESRLARKIEAILGRSVGADKVRAQVNAEMDFDRESIAEEKFDPEGRVVRSTQSSEEKTVSTDKQAQKPVTVQGNLRRTGQEPQEGTSSSSQTTKTNERTNYEISKTVKNHVRVTGQVKRLSVAVVVDGTYAGEPGKATYKPRSKEDIDRLTALVKSTMGFDEKRGDTVEVANLAFAGGAPVAADKEGEGSFIDLTKNDYMRIAEIAVLAILAILVILMVIRPLLRKLFEIKAPQAAGPPQLTGHGPNPALPGPQSEGLESYESMIDIGKVEGRVKASSLKKVGDIVDKHPEETVAIIRNWMYQET